MRFLSTASASLEQTIDYMRKRWPEIAEAAEHPLAEWGVERTVQVGRKEYNVGVYRISCHIEDLRQFSPMTSKEILAALAAANLNLSLKPYSKVFYPIFITAFFITLFEGIFFWLYFQFPHVFGPIWWLRWLGYAWISAVSFYIFSRSSEMACLEAINARSHRIGHHSPIILAFATIFAFVPIASPLVGIRPPLKIAPKYSL